MSKIRKMVFGFFENKAEEPPATEAPPAPPKPAGKQRRQSVASSKPGSHKHHKKVDHGKHGEPPKPDEGAMPEEPKAEEPRKSQEARKSDEARKSGDVGKPPGLAPAQVENVASRHAGFGLAPTPSDIIQGEPQPLPVSFPPPHATNSDHGLGSGSNSRTEGLIPILLYEQNMEKKKLPSWMKHYRYVAYVIYFLIACYSWAYLAFIGYFQGHPRMQIQYIPVVKFLEFNSYSVLSPLLCSVFMALLAYHVHKQINLNEGDFFGLLGLLLLFSMINLHDGFGVYRIANFTEADYNQTSKKHLDPPQHNKVSRNELHWQYAWSTRPSCAKKYVRDMTYQYEQDMRHFKKQILIAPTSTLAERAIEQVATANLGMAKLRCKEWHNAKDKAKTRFWMRDLQQEFKCCGPYGLKQWKEWFANVSDTGCDEAWYDADLMDVPDCFDPLMRWFHGIFEIMMVIMFIQSGLWIIAMIFASIHFAAMKYEREAPERTFSLLNMTDPEANKHEDLAWARPSNHGNVDEKGGTKGDEAQTMLQIQKDTSDHHRHSKHSKKHLK